MLDRGALRFTLRYSCRLIPNCTLLAALGRRQSLRNLGNVLLPLVMLLTRSAASPAS